MVPVDLKTLLSKLNPVCLRALVEGAAGLCLSRTNYEIEIEHYLLKLLELGESDLPRILRQYSVNIGVAQRELTAALDRLKRGSSRTPGLSPGIRDTLRETWALSSLNWQASKIRSGYILAALLMDPELSRTLREICPSLAKISAEDLGRNLPALIAGLPEDQYESAGATSSEGTAAAAGGEPRPATGSKTPTLDQYTINLTEKARKGEIDPVIGRDFEIRQVIDILTRRRQNNPILTGEAGVGKTAVVEGFAQLVVAGDVPLALRNIAVRTLDLGLLQAGAGIKGEFENRLKQVIAEVKSSPQPIILFIDEAHTLIGAGGQAGQGDAANLLKPALARGELRTIAATTWMEYKKYFETDAAFKRRFQVVKVDEPDVARAITMIRGLAATMEKHHQVRVHDEALQEAVKLSHRYLTDRQLPDKAVSLLDTACARVALSQSALPPTIQDCRRELELLGVELGILQRESNLGANHDQRVADILEAKAKGEQRLKDLETRWEKEKELAGKIKTISSRLDAHHASTRAPEVGVPPSGGSPTPKPAQAGTPTALSADDEKKTRAELADLEKQLQEIQGENPLVIPVVGGEAIAQVVSGWTGVPVGRMVRDEIQAVLNLKEKLQERVMGQSHALEAIAQRIRTARASLTDPRRPIGVFMLVGPSGVGKTETAISLAEILFGSDRSMVVINMSEYKESSKISNLTGSAKGLVGYGEPGALTEPVRRKPYCVRLLLDEVEKAHTDVQELFYQVFDKGMLQDSSGNDVNFKNTIIIMCSNVGSDTIMKLCADPDTRPDPEGLATALRGDLLKAFKPALLGRISVIPYYPLDDVMLKNIIRLQLRKIGDRLRENHRAVFTFDEALLTTIAGRCTEVESGARNVDHILNGSLLPELSSEILARTAQGNPVLSAHVGVSPEGKFTYKIG